MLICEWERNGERQRHSTQNRNPWMTLSERALQTAQEVHQMQPEMERDGQIWALCSSGYKKHEHYDAADTEGIFFFLNNDKRPKDEWIAN